MIYKFPNDCTLIEWSEQQQTFFINDVENGRPDKQINKNGVLIVHACANYKIAFKIIDYIEKYVIKKASKPLTTFQITAHIKALIKFSDTYCKIGK